MGCRQGERRCLRGRSVSPGRLRRLDGSWLLGRGDGGPSGSNPMSPSSPPSPHPSNAPLDRAAECAGSLSRAGSEFAGEPGGMGCVPGQTMTDLTRASPAGAQWAESSSERVARPPAPQHKPTSCIVCSAPSSCGRISEVESGSSNPSTGLVLGRGAGGRRSEPASGASPPFGRAVDRDSLRRDGRRDRVAAGP